MHRDLPMLLPLICPRCRTRGERGIELHTVSLAEEHRAHGDEIIEGVLRCEHSACGASYPIIEGIPILVTDPAALVARQLPTLAMWTLHPATLAALVARLHDDDPLARLVEHLSIYLDAHHGDRAVPPARAPAPAFGFAPFVERLRALPPAQISVELGCSVGRGLVELSRTSALTVGVDLQLGTLVCARRLLAGEALDFLRRRSGRHYEAARIDGNLTGAGRIALICGDALDPPLAPASSDRVCALNTLDSVRDPRQLLSVLDGLLVAEGTMALASPYAWQSEVVDDATRINAADPAAAVTAILRHGEGLGARYAVIDEHDLTWTLRRDDRSAHVYSAHWLLARKG